MTFHKSGDFQHTVGHVTRTANGKMWAILGKNRSLFAIPLSFAHMLYQQGGQAYVVEVWLPLVRTGEMDRLFPMFVQHFFHLRSKTSWFSTFLLARTTTGHHVDTRTHLEFELHSDSGSGLE